MKRLVILSFLSFIPTLSFSEPCRPSSRTPCEPDEKTRKNLTQKIQDYLTKKSAFDDALRDWQAAKDEADKVIELSRFENLLKAGQIREEAGSDMLARIEAEYHTAPPKLKGTARALSSSGYEWASGLEARWRVRIATGEMDYRLFKTRHGMHAVPTPAAAIAATTYPDGEALISLETITDAAVENNPGVIASILYHESRHFSRLITKGWDYHEKEEIVAYSAEIEHRDAFGLSQSWIDAQDQHLAEFRADELAGKRSAFSISPEDERKVEEIVAERESGEANLAAYYQTLKTAVENSRREQEEEQRRTSNSRNHDEQLRAKYLELADRSCEIPGSVTQEELDSLPLLPYDEDSLAQLPTGDCVKRVYMAIQKHELAEYIELISRPRVIPLPTGPQDSPPPAEVIAGSTFESILPRLQEFAGLACKYQGGVPRLPKELFTPRVPYFFTPRDEAAFSSLTGGLDKCERRVFRRLFEMLRDQRGDQIDDRWLMQAVADPPPPAVIIPPAGEGGGGGSRVPTGCIPGDRSRRNCIACGNRYCP